VKQVIVVNKSLKMPKGKLAAQAAHAAVAAFLEAREDEIQAWVMEGMPKVVLEVEDENALLDLQSRADAADLPTALIEDAGRTVLPAGTITCLGIGPADDDAINRLTGDLRLLG
jgi:peptidyl-tRNA hydrolase